LFFVISKLVETILLPSNLIGLLGVLGLLLLALHRRRSGAVLLVMATLLLAVVGWSPIGVAGLVLLEDRFPQPTITGDVAGIIVLGGEIDTHISSDRGAVAVNDAGERLTAAAELSQRYPDARIILAGGANHLLFGQAKTESAYARDLLVAIGVSDSRIELEEKSRNTCEDAIESKAVVQPKPGEQWLLVTSASHMPRAVACFRAVDFPIIAYPVDYRTRGRADLKALSNSIADGLEAADLAAHEWIGLVAYHFVKSTELFPAPSR
jgi:uncharacterized SAM-binding protein YcdF (DUF218 family)